MLLLSHVFAATGIAPKEWYPRAAAGPSGSSQEGAAAAAPAAGGAGPSNSRQQGEAEGASAGAAATDLQAVQALIQAEEQGIAELMGRAAAALAAVGEDGRGTRTAAAAASGASAPAAVDEAAVRAFLSPPDEDVTEGELTAEDVVWDTCPDLAQHAAAATAAAAAAAGEEDSDDDVQEVVRVVSLQEAKQAAETVLLYCQDNPTLRNQRSLVQHLQKVQDALMDFTLLTARQQGIEAFFPRA